MFEFLKQSILKRYSREQLAEIYGVKLPNAEAIYEKSQGMTSSTPINANFYSILNRNKFVKSGGEKCEVRVDKENGLVMMTARLSWFQKLMLMISLFINGIMDKIFGALENLIPKLTSKIPAGLIGFVSGPLTIITSLIAVPLLIAKALFGAINTIINQVRSQGMLGLVIGIVLAILFFFIQIFVIVLTALLSPVMDKIVDKVINKTCIRNMMIGHFTLNNNYDGMVILSPDMVTSVSYDTHSSLLGKEKLFVTIKESEAKASFIDRIRNSFVPTYFVNRQTVIVTDVENKSFFDGVFKV